MVLGADNMEIFVPDWNFISASLNRVEISTRYTELKFLHVINCNVIIKRSLLFNQDEISTRYNIEFKFQACLKIFIWSAPRYLKVFIKDSLHFLEAATRCIL